MESTIVGKLRVRITGGTVVHPQSGATLVIDEEVPRIIGRGESCHLRLQDGLVSTAHCELAATERGVMVRDLASRNGTRVNDILLGPGQHVLLRRPAKIRLGDSELEFTPKRGPERELFAGFGGMEFPSLKMKFLMDQLVRVAMLNTSVHITGEIGTGKTFLARMIHEHSTRAGKPFVMIDCGAIPTTLAAGELFGYVKGAFTGATAARSSPFEDGDGGTVFLDECGDLPLEVQPQLLLAVEEGMVKRVGQNRYTKVNVRIISATKHDLAARVNAGLFRDDLNSRLTAARIEVPPLRDRQDDVEVLVARILADLGSESLIAEIPRAKLAWLAKKPWPGNVRQLRQVISNVVDLMRHGALDAATAIDMAYGLSGADAGPATADPPSIHNVLTAKGTTLAAAREEADRIVLETLFRETNGNLSKIAERAGVTRGSIRSLLEHHGIRKRAKPNGWRAEKRS